MNMRLNVSSINEFDGQVTDDSAPSIWFIGVVMTMPMTVGNLLVTYNIVVKVYRHTRTHVDLYQMLGCEVLNVVEYADFSVCVSRPSGSG